MTERTDFDLEWTTEREDLREALTWRFLHVPRLRIVAIVFCLCGLFGVAEVVLAVTGHPQGNVLSTVVLLIFPILLVLLPRLQSRSVMRNNPTLREPTRMALSDTGITVYRRSATVQTAWTDFAGLQETGRSYLLRYTGLKVELLIPKRAVGADQAGFRRFLDDHVGRD